MMSVQEETGKKTVGKTLGTFKFVVFSLIGMFMFFIDISIGGVKTTPLQHIYNWLNGLLGPAVPFIAMLFVIAGAALPFIRGTFNRSMSDRIFTVFKVLGAGVAVMAAFNLGPELFKQPDYLPFLWDNLVCSITLMSVIYGIGFVPLMYYGVVEFFGALMQKIMRKVFHTPGQSALDALVSTISAYGTALLVTNKLYKRGVYTARESAIIATGFSTVAVSFMLIIANTLGLGEHSSLFLITCLLATFGTTAVTARIYPITRIPNSYYDKPAEQPPQPEGSVLVFAWNQGVETARNAKSMVSLFKDYYVDAVLMLTSQVASILSIGLLGILIADMTPVFDIIGLIFYPFTWLFQIPEPMLAAKGAAIEIAEMFLPAAVVAGAPVITKFTVGVTSVSAILFFSACIPALTATDIPLKMKDILIIWIERTILSLGIASAVAHIFLR
ncbi:YjiH family protein [[Clostridium] symbiosum]|uniref:YjiH family protein n=1 Tax=Clostridium symbiosum TaxID=1512 RepID=UPI001D092B22|nr:YjiH family protein [[Clostridium] symbiosum]MCB6608662.1 YjiH family protein [[Clostridium] symbiosum]MCB6932280.1 YjiH family protein [[Clostridium] symbiosum]